MYVKMSKTQKGCDDDNLNLVKVYHENETYEVGPDLGGVFIREGWAKKAKKPKQAVEDESPEEKDEGDSEENKDEGDSEENKSE